uniref:Septin 4a n=1 Tax=Seriola lalandi dorsalis TaxID=1841481 RepID=A0A3B4XNY2_SERLL
MEHMSSPVRFRSNKKAGTFSEKELSSLSIEDQEDTQFPFAMRDLPPVSPGHQAPVNREADGTGTATNGRLPSLPGTPPLHRPIPCLLGSPIVPPRPNRVGVDAEFQPLPLRRQLVSQVSLDSPLSPASRPRSPWGRFDPYDSPEDQDKEYVGFATLPNQVHRKTVKKGFTFTLMVAGESGLGKSTLINSLFLTDLYKDRKVPNAEERINQTVDIVKHTISIEEKGIKLRLSIIDTPGFGDAIDNTESWKQIEDYIDQQFEQYFRDESGLNRRNIQDNRVHCCLYFISPFGHGLRPLDVECMRALHEKVNIVPILAKADSLTEAEVCRKKMKIREDIRQFGINIYQFPECDSDEDEDFQRQDQLLKDSIPFAIIGSNVQVESKGRKFRGRVYPWGVVEVENPAHSDFLLLRNMLVRTHMQDLKDVTRETHYENYRAQCIQNMTRMVVQERKRSLREKHRDGSEADFPLPLAVVDAEKERLIYEKDEEVHLSNSLTHSLTHPSTHSFTTVITTHFIHLSLSAAEEDAGGAGEDSGADAERWLLILP